MKSAYNISGLISGITGVAATVLGFFWIQSYDTLNTPLNLFNSSYSQFQMVTWIFIPLISATLFLMSLSYFGFKSSPGNFGAVLGLLVGAFIISIWIYDFQPFIQIPILINIGVPLLFFWNISSTAISIYFIIYLAMITLAALGIILVDQREEITPPGLALVGGILLIISAIVVFFFYFGLTILFVAFIAVAISLYKREQK